MHARVNRMTPFAALSNIENVLVPAPIRACSRTSLQFLDCIQYVRLHFFIRCWILLQASLFFALLWFFLLPFFFLKNDFSRKTAYIILNDIRAEYRSVQISMLINMRKWRPLKYYSWQYVSVILILIPSWSKDSFFSLIFYQFKSKKVNKWFAQLIYLFYIKYKKYKNLETL